ncbi:MAG TPA: PqqD family peptide modification chaperone [Ignavibacteriaceae bacterium]|nr:PqqD family peptide modification chaperone [Ignavibacteriaceae bacterium]
MEVGFLQRRKILKNQNALDLTPIRKYSEETDESGLVSIIIPKFKNKFVREHILPKLKSPEVKVKLDELGSASWLLFDGKNTVSLIAQKLVEKFGDRIQPVEERILKYTTNLYLNGFITFKEIQKGN